MNQESLNHLDRLINEAALELFAAYKVQLSAGGSRGHAAREVFAATIGFTNDEQLKGALVISLCRDLAVHSMPPQLSGRAGEAGMVADWTGELANQLIGRIKRKLSHFKVDINLSTPVVFKGQALDLCPQKSDIFREHDFGHGTGAFHLVLQLAVPKDFELVPAGGSAAGLEEGEVSLF